MSSSSSNDYAIAKEFLTLSSVSNRGVIEGVLERVYGNPSLSRPHLGFIGFDPVKHNNGIIEVLPGIDAPMYLFDNSLKHGVISVLLNFSVEAIKNYWFSDDSMKLSIVLSLKGVLTTITFPTAYLCHIRYNTVDGNTIQKDLDISLPHDTNLLKTIMDEEDHPVAMQEKAVVGIKSASSGKSHLTRVK